MTPHIHAEKEEIASSVIMPGDPLRAKFIAETYLTDVKQVSGVRGIYAYTGYYKEKKVTVMASGMGMPSIGIYSYELFKFYDVEEIIRVGSCGSYKEDLNLYDVILVTEAYSTSSFAKVQNGSLDEILTSNEELNLQVERAAKTLQVPLHKGRIYSSDVFYTEKSVFEKMRDEYDCLGVEMESFALFHNAHVLKKRATCILTVSDSFVKEEQTTPLEREKSFTKMIELALQSLV